MFKVNHKDLGVFNVNIVHISHHFLAVLLLTLKREMFSGKEKEEESEEIKISLSGFERSAENFNT